MKLLGHNFLRSNVKGVKNGFPLKIIPKQVDIEEADFDQEFLKNIFSRIDYHALVQAYKDMKGDMPLPEDASEGNLQSQDFLKQFHHALLEVVLVEGSLICPESGREYPVVKGVPNMLLKEDEVA